MIQHLFKLAWNRRRTTGLLLVEILVCFLVLSAVFVGAVRYGSRWNDPLGFRYENVWRIDLGFPESGPRSIEEQTALAGAIQEIVQHVGQLRGAESVAVMNNSPYSSSTNQNTTYVDGLPVTYLWTRCSLSTLELFGLEIVKGRWFTESDDDRADIPVVLDSEFAAEMFRDQDPLGRVLDNFDENGNVIPREPGEKEYRVIGLIDRYRRDGELSASSPVSFMFHRLDRPVPYPPADLLVRVQPGTSASFEEDLVTTVRRLQPGWSIESESLSGARGSRLRSKIAPLLVGLVVAGFLVGTAGLGLVGVLWQSVTARTQEIGLRRALGASMDDVKRQIAGELGALACAALLLGSVLLVQVPFLFPILGITSVELTSAILLAGVLILVFVGLCAWYPAQLAARVEPARALQYE